MKTEARTNNNMIDIGSARINQVQRMKNIADGLHYYIGAPVFARRDVRSGVVVFYVWESDAADDPADLYNLHGETPLEQRLTDARERLSEIITEHEVI